MRCLVPKGKELEIDLKRLRDLNEKVLRLDGSLFSEKRRELVQQMSEAEKNLLKKELLDELEKMGMDKKMEEMEAEIARRNENVYRNLGEAAEYLSAGKISESVESMNKAIFLENKIYSLAKQIKWLEGKVLKLTKRDIRVEKKREAE